MPRPIWSGSISFGLVNVPIKLFSAVSPQDVRFHQLRKSDGSRIRQKRVSAADGAEVAYEEIVKGYEVGPDQYVLVDPEELAALDPKATQTIDIEEFVDLDQIDPIYYEHPYYLVPDKRAEKAYALLREAMRQTNKVAIARFVMRTKQYLAAVRPGPDGVLVLSTMLYADEVVPVDKLEGLPGPEVLGEVSDRELQMAERVGRKPHGRVVRTGGVPRHLPPAGAGTDRCQGGRADGHAAGGGGRLRGPGRRPDGRARGQRPGGQGTTGGRGVQAGARQCARSRARPPAAPPRGSGVEAAAPATSASSFRHRRRRARPGGRG